MAETIFLNKTYGRQETPIVIQITIDLEKLTFFDFFQNKFEQVFYTGKMLWVVCVK